ncbi:9493_t:CDS:2 [Rhizophagus irregularis]|nr:9493_t:CDS:2 [Rhizophagus irregularis]
MSIDNSKLLIQDISKLFNNSNNYDVKIIVGKDYSLDEENNEKYIIDLLIAADELGIFELVEHIQENIIYSKVSWIQNNFMQVYNLAFKNVGLEFIRKYCDELINLTQDDYEELKNRLHGILEHIRFFTMSSDDFWNKIWPLKDLLPDNILNKLVNYNLPSRIPPPTDIPQEFVTLNIALRMSEAWIFLKCH